MPESLDPPTLGEIIRRLEHIADQQAEIIREIKADRAEAARTYVRQDVYIAERQLQEANVSDLRTDITATDHKVEANHESYKKDRAADAAGRRQLTMWLGSLTATVLFGIGGFIIALLTLLR